MATESEQYAARVAAAEQRIIELGSLYIRAKRDVADLETNLSTAKVNKTARWNDLQDAYGRLHDVEDGRR